MKTLFAASLAVLAAHQVAADECSTTVITALLTDEYIDQCATDSGYVFTAATIPDQDTIDLMCASAACNNLLADVTAMDLTECTLPVGDNINLLADLVDYVPARCPSSSGSTEATATSGSSTGEDTIVAPSSSASEESVASTAESASEEATSSEATTDSEASASAASASESGSSGAVSLSTSVLSAASVVVAIAGAYML